MIPGTPYMIYDKHILRIVGILATPLEPTCKACSGKQTIARSHSAYLSLSRWPEGHPQLLRSRPTPSERLGQTSQRLDQTSEKLGQTSQRLDQTSQRFCLRLLDLKTMIFTMFLRARKLLRSQGELLRSSGQLLRSWGRLLRSSDQPLRTYRGSLYRIWQYHWVHPSYAIALVRLQQG